MYAPSLPSERLATVPVANSPFTNKLLSWIRLRRKANPAPPKINRYTENELDSNTGRGMQQCSHHHRQQPQSQECGASNSNNIAATRPAHLYLARTRR